MRLRTSRRRRTQSPCTVTVASELGLFLQPYSVHTSKRTKHVFSFLVQFHKIFCDSYFDGSFRDIYRPIFTTHCETVTKKQGRVYKRDTSWMQRTFDGSLFQTTTRAPLTEAFIRAPVTEAFISGSLVRSTMRRSLELSVSTHHVCDCCAYEPQTVTND